MKENLENDKEKTKKSSGGRRRTLIIAGIVAAVVISVAGTAAAVHFVNVSGEEMPGEVMADVPEEGGSESTESSWENEQPDSTAAGNDETAGTTETEETSESSSTAGDIQGETDPAETGQLSDIDDTLVSGEEEISDGVDYELMAQKCAALIADYSSRYGEPDECYFANVDEDQVPELIVRSGSDEADYAYDIYTFDGSSLVKAQQAIYGDLYESDGAGLLVQYQEMDSETDYEKDCLYDLKSETVLFDGVIEYDEDTWEPLNTIEIPEDFYWLSGFSDYDEESIYDILQVYE